MNVNYSIRRRIRVSSFILLGLLLSLRSIGVSAFCLTNVCSSSFSSLLIQEKRKSSNTLVNLVLSSPSEEIFLNAIHCKEQEVKILNGRHSSLSDSVRIAMSYILEGDSRPPLKLASSLRHVYDYPYNITKHNGNELNKTEIKYKKNSKNVFVNDDFYRGSLIVDIKRKSLSRIGEVFTRFEDAGMVAESFISLGTDVVFINVDYSFYGGDIKELKSAVSAVRKVSDTAAVVMKDIVVDEIQLGLAKEANADGILLIASVLGSSLEKFLDFATTIGLETIVECHTPNEVQVAIDALAQNILVLNYDRIQQKYYPDQAYNLAGMFPGRGGPVICLAGGGIDTTKEVKRLLSVGYDGVVVGKAVMSNNKASEFIRAVKDVKLLVP